MIKKSNYGLLLLVAVLSLGSLTNSVQAQLYTDTPTTIASNNVGIGANIPQARLHVTSFVGTPSFRLQHSSTSVLTNAWDVYAGNSGMALEFKKFFQDNKGSSATTIFSLEASGANVFGDLNVSDDAYVGNLLGINTTSPSEALHINSGFAKADGYLLTSNSSNQSSWNAPWYGLSLVQETDLDLDAENTGSNPIVLQSYYGLAFRTSAGFMAMDNHGIVSIGLDGSDMKELARSTNTSSPYKLYVAEGIRTEEVLIDLKDNANWWPDYVFAEDYNLRPLSEVEAFIQKNKHLPDVPSAKEVEAEGIKVKEMNAVLLKKIEELTLYVIELEKKVEALKNK